MKFFLFHAKSARNKCCWWKNTMTNWEFVCLYVSISFIWPFFSCSIQYIVTSVYAFGANNQDCLWMLKIHARAREPPIQQTYSPSIVSDYLLQLCFSFWIIQKLSPNVYLQHLLLITSDSYTIKSYPDNQNWLSICSRKCLSFMNMQIFAIFHQMC